ncbi:hypothetical protein [uncultured Mycobacterium sp.]|uniref:hypothetical protein n=1 Tax=uncultured Mycobacterium sp. TaxID=171292 RepID=UPI0035CAA994
MTPKQPYAANDRATLANAAAGGDTLAVLCCLRDRLAAELDAATSARDVAALSHQLTDVLARIQAVRAARVMPAKIDELRARRARRRAAATRGDSGKGADT